ncbi:hypothetical protein OG875_00840 [Streptomyces sp. NBC_01498]|uniref:hypothetical protein n=1 Tax=Streptomyces sp. NBC_01498 TaxID=2975870 RepID=UPI002E7BBD20|nr:hypothetical protein [Streptomyces sp. NBC_01498]WTL23268.1 hypothetical protein OG875_00840 [Streptomyces sp. NBC_01498]
MSDRARRDGRDYEDAVRRAGTTRRWGRAVTAAVMTLIPVAVATTVVAALVLVPAAFSARIGGAAA